MSHGKVDKSWYGMLHAQIHSPRLTSHWQREAGAVANGAEQRKKQKFSSLMISHHFVPIDIETSGVFGSEAITSFKELLGQWTKFESGDPDSFHFLIQRAAVAIQQGNTAAVLDTLPV